MLNRAGSSVAGGMRYDNIAIMLHWVVALLIISVGVIGLAFGYGPRAMRPYWLNLHGVVGLVTFVAIIVRVLWRVWHRPPALPAGTGRLVSIASKGFHHLVYVLMIVIPVLGLISYIWHARSFDVGLLRIVPGIAANRAIYHPTQDLHVWLAYGLMAALVIHVLAVFWHQCIRRDDLITRMLPGQITCEK